MSSFFYFLFGNNFQINKELIYDNFLFTIIFLITYLLISLRVELLKNLLVIYFNFSYFFFLIN